MQTIHKNEDEGDNSRRTDLINLIIYIRRVYRYLERKHIGRFGSRRSRI